MWKLGLILHFDISIIDYFDIPIIEAREKGAFFEL